MSRFRPVILFVALIGLAYWVAGPGWHVYGIAAFGLLALKGAAAVSGPGPAPITSIARARMVSVVIPVYNEDPASLAACIRAAVEHPQVDEVIVVDDGSTDSGTVQYLDALQAADNRPPGLTFLRHRNLGKREALRTGVDALTDRCDWVATIDSDTLIGPDTIPAAVAEFRFDGDELGAVTGLVRAANWRRNVLTRMQDIRYANAFLWERAAYSRVGAVLCVCGSFTLWDRDLLEELVDPLCDQTFRGQPCTFGDDRHLTNLALQRGYQVRLAEGAVAETYVPERVGHWVRQQTRWSKSFIRESWWSLQNLPLGSWAYVFAFVEFTTWIVFTGMIALSLFLAPVLVGPDILLAFVVWIFLTSWARSVRWFDARPDAGFLDRVWAIVVSPLYGVVHLIVILPLRFYALASMSKTEWGTRTEVEVTA